MSTCDHEPRHYAPSSWNYGSFHQCNPYYQQKESTHQYSSANVRSQSGNLNEFGKRHLPEEERIVTEGYLQMMKEYKQIKSIDSVNNKFKRNKSSANLNRKTSQNFQNSQNSQNSENNNSMNNSRMNTSQQNQKNNKSFKYQLNFDEWAAVKAKQQEIYKKVRIIKESEDQNFEFFNKKIDENYKVIQEQNFNEWLQKKQGEKIKTKVRKSRAEELKDLEKQKKQSENQARLEEWFRRQAQMMENDAKLKKMKSDKIKAEKEKKRNEEEMRKARASEAYKLWMRKKEDDKKLEKRINAPQTTGKMKRTNTSLNRTKIVIGPYTNAGDLKEIQKKIFALRADSAMYSDNPNSNPDEEGEEEKQIYEKENIEDSLQELSSIKKDSPVQEQDGDYY